MFWRGAVIILFCYGEGDIQHLLSEYNHMENLVAKLNQALQADDFSEDDFIHLIKGIIEKERTLLRILDFTYFNEERLEHVSAEKGKAIKSGDYESAALWLLRS